LLSESEVKEIKDGMEEVDEILTASSENGLFEGIRLNNTEQIAEISTRKSVRASD
jgi:hypothetical protein